MLISASASAASTVALIASDVSGAPSWNLMPGRSLTSHDGEVRVGRDRLGEVGLHLAVLVARARARSNTAPPIM